MSINEAMVSVCERLGWDRVAYYVWPDKPLHRSEARLRACLGSDRSEKLALEEILALIRYAGEQGCHAVMESICTETNYAMPPFWSREQRLADEMRRFVRLVGEVDSCGQRILDLQRPFFDEEGFAKAQTERGEPEIIRREMARMRDEIWSQLTIRDGEKCSGCGSSENLTIDHIRPVSRGGDNRLENLQILCQSCNSSKGDRYLEAVR